MKLTSLGVVLGKLLPSAPKARDTDSMFRIVMFGDTSAGKTHLMNGLAGITKRGSDVGRPNLLGERPNTRLPYTVGFPRGQYTRERIKGTEGVFSMAGEVGSTHGRVPLEVFDAQGGSMDQWAAAQLQGQEANRQDATAEDRETVEQITRALERADVVLFLLPPERLTGDEARTRWLNHFNILLSFLKNQSVSPTVALVFAKADEYGLVSTAGEPLHGRLLRTREVVSAQRRLRSKLNLRDEEKLAFQDMVVNQFPLEMRPAVRHLVAETSSILEQGPGEFNAYFVAASPEDLLWEPWDRRGLRELLADIGYQAVRRRFHLYQPPGWERPLPWRMLTTMASCAALLLLGFATWLFHDIRTDLEATEDMYSLRDWQPPSIGTLPSHADVASIANHAQNRMKRRWLGSTLWTDYSARRLALLAVACSYKNGNGTNDMLMTNPETFLTRVKDPPAGEAKMGGSESQTAGGLPRLHKVFRDPNNGGDTLVHDAYRDRKTLFLNWNVIRDNCNDLAGENGPSNVPEQAIVNAWSGLANTSAFGVTVDFQTPLSRALERELKPLLVPAISFKSAETVQQLRRLEKRPAEAFFKLGLCPYSDVGMKHFWHSQLDGYLHSGIGSGDNSTGPSLEWKKRGKDDALEDWEVVRLYSTPYPQAPKDDDRIVVDLRTRYTLAPDNGTARPSHLTPQDDGRLFFSLLDEIVFIAGSPVQVEAGEGTQPVYRPDPGTRYVVKIELPELIATNGARREQKPMLGLVCVGVTTQPDRARPDNALEAFAKVYEGYGELATELTDTEHGAERSTVLAAAWEALAMLEPKNANAFRSKGEETIIQSYYTAQLQAWKREGNVWAQALVQKACADANGSIAAWIEAFADTADNGAPRAFAEYVNSNYSLEVVPAVVLSSLTAKEAGDGADTLADTIANAAKLWLIRDWMSTLDLGNNYYVTSIEKIDEKHLSKSLFNALTGKHDKFSTGWSELFMGQTNIPGLFQKENASGAP